MPVGTYFAGFVHKLPAMQTRRSAEFYASPPYEYLIPSRMRSEQTLRCVFPSQSMPPGFSVENSDELMLQRQSIQLWNTVDTELWKVLSFSLGSPGKTAMDPRYYVWRCHDLQLFFRPLYGLTFTFLL